MPARFAVSSPETGDEGAGSVPIESVKGTVSASLGYKFGKNLTITLEGKDLNDPLLKSYATNKDQPRAFYKNGRQIYLGLRAQI